MSVTFDFLSSPRRPVIVREVDMSETPSSVSGSDCSSQCQSSIKIRILPRTTAWNTATDADNELLRPRGVAVPTKRSVLTVQQTRQSHQHHQQSVKPSCSQADGNRKRRHISVKRFAFNCLSAKPASVEYYDVGTERPCDDVTSQSNQFITTSVKSDATVSFSQRDQIGRSIIKSVAESSKSSPATAAHSQFADSSRHISVGQKFSVSFSTKSVLPGGEHDNEDRCSTTDTPSCSAPSTDFRQQRNISMSRAGVEATVSHTTVVRRHVPLKQSTLNESQNCVRQQSDKGPATSTVDQRRLSVVAPSSSGDGLVIRRALSNYEADELTGYQNIYFIGQATCGRKLTFSETGNRETLTNNDSNYDDTQGFYNFVSHDHIAYR